MTTKTPTLADLTEDLPLAPEDRWNDDGVLILPGFMPDHLISEYASEWAEANGLHSIDENDLIQADNPGGFRDTDYLRYFHLYNLMTYGPLGQEIEKLIGEPAGVHLCLTGWVSTERDFHQDYYLNETCVKDKYAAVWIALGDIHPDSGPFEYVPGSHHWPVLTKEKIGQVVDLQDPNWPKHSEDALVPLYNAEFERRDAPIETYLPKKGDVLIWHPRLVHRGSKAKTPGRYRPAAIGHFSGVNHRTDMPRAIQAAGGGWAFPLGMFGFQDTPQVMP